MPEPREPSQNQEAENPEDKGEKPDITYRNLQIEDGDKMFDIRNEIVLEEKVPFGSGKEISKEEYLTRLQKGMEVESKGGAL